jgi:hypothetical protein
MKRAIAALCAAAALCSCGSATDHVTFQPPPEFKPSVSIGPFGQMWEGPNHTMMMLMAFPTQLDLDKSVSQTGMKDTTMQHEAHVKICGDQEALFGNMIGNSRTAGDAAQKNAKPQQIEFLATNVSGKTYMAMYMRPQGAPADTAAQAALHKVCPK